MKGVFDCRQNNDELMGFALFYFSITGLEYFMGDQTGDVCNFSVFEILGVLLLRKKFEIIPVLFLRLLLERFWLL